MSVLRDSILQIRTPGVSFYVLKDNSGLYLLDSGFIGGLSSLRRALRQHGWHHEPICGIIITHGHLDHILNVARVAKQSGAWIAAPRLDADHYRGKPCYSGLARVTGILERLGRYVLRFQTFRPTRWLDGGDFIDVWHGLRTIHLPGHTHGHMGFYCERHKLLFTADLFASYRGMSHFPPSIFNSAPEKVPGSVAAALALDLSGVMPNHCDQAEPAEHLRRLRGLAKKSEWG